MHHLQNRDGVVPPITCSVPTAPAFGGLCGAPDAQFNTLWQLLATEPVTLDLLHSVLAADFARSPLACLLADELATRCVLPAAMPADEQQVWREVLLHALRLPAWEWEMAVLDLRGSLQNAREHPLLAALRDASYRPQDMPRLHWNSLLSATPKQDCHTLALGHQRQHLGNSDMQARDAWATAQLRALAPQADSQRLQAALRAMRQREQRERGLLDVRVGLRHLIEHDAAPLSAIHAGSRLATACGTGPLVARATPAGASELATLLVQTARSATWTPPSAVRRLGRFDSVSHALTSLLCLPTLQDLGRTVAASGTRVSVDTCVPLPAGTDANTHAYALHVARTAVDGLTRHAPPAAAADSTALISCTPQERYVAGLHVEQAGQIIHFMRRQQPGAGTVQQAREALAHLFTSTRATVPQAAVPAPPDTHSCPSAGLEEWVPPRARAGALTDEGAAVPPALAGAALLPGAGAQLPGEMDGAVPLLLMQGLIDSISSRSWWSAIPGYTARSAQGLLQTLNALFALGGERLHGRPPSADALERFFGTAQGTALFEAINQLPELSTWQQYEVERGGMEAQIYVFMRMLKQLLRTLTSRETARDPVHSRMEQEACFALARMGLAAGELLTRYDGNAPDAGRTFFRRVVERYRPAALHSPTPVDADVIKAHAAWLAPGPSTFCVPINEQELRQWWVVGTDPLLGEEGFSVLLEPARCLAQIAVVHSRLLYGGMPPPWRTAQPGMRQWRELADARTRSGKQVLTWEASLGEYFHGTARMLRDWMRLQQDQPLTANELNLGVHLRRLVEPLQQLYSQVELPLQDADPWYAESLDHFEAFYRRVGNQLQAPVAPGTSPNMPVRSLPLEQWLEAHAGHALAQAICPFDAVSLRDGLAITIQRALISANAAVRHPLDAWTLIIEGPHLLQQWLDSTEGRTAVARWVDAVNDGAVRSGAVDKKQSAGWQAHATLLRKAVLSQLPPDIQQKVVALLEVPTLFKGGAAPVLTLAQAMAEADPLLLRHPEHALLLALALLPVEAPADASRMALGFPLWPLPSTNTSTAEGSGLLLERWFHRPPPSPVIVPLDTRTLPDLHTLLRRWGLDVLHNVDPDAALPPAELWDLMSRTQGFAELGRQLLGQTDWAGAQEDGPGSPQGAQIVVAQALLEHHVGRTQIDTLRAEFNSPVHVHRSFVQWQSHVAALLAARHRNAPAAARDLLQWLLLSELQQPALLVRNIPDGLSPASLAGSTFLHSIALLEGLQPGSSGRVSYMEVAGLAAALAAPPPPSGADDLQASWARAMLQPALLYGVAHGQLPDLVRLDQVTSEQACHALEYLKQAQDAHAAHLALITRPAPTRRRIAEQKLAQTGLDPALWTLPINRIGTQVLNAHGITAGPLLQTEETLLLAATPIGTDDLDESLKTQLSASDSLLNLIAADAYRCAGQPTTLQQFNEAFATYRSAVEQGLAGVIEALLQALPPEDRTLLSSSHCTPMQVRAFGQDAAQGLLLQCQPHGRDEPVYFEILPRAGLMRRAVVDPRLGPCVDAQGLIDGSIVLSRNERLTAVRDLQLTPMAAVMQRDTPVAVHVLAAAAAKLLWDAPLDKMKKRELSQLTPLEQALQKEEALLKKTAEFTLPFFACGEALLSGESGTAALDCGVDLLSNVIPGATFAGTLVRTVTEAGEHTVLSLAAHTGDALRTFAGELLRNSGAGLVFDLGKGAARLGGQAWEQALRSAGWVRGVLGGERALGAAAHSVETEVSAGRATHDLLAGFEVGEATLAVGQVDGQPLMLVISGPDGWYRFDPIAGAGYGPPLQQVSLVTPLPGRLPGERFDAGVRLHLGDATDARFIERGDNQWEVWIGNTPYLLEPDDGSLHLREVHGGRIGELQELDGTGCRVRRGIESAGAAAGCSRPTQLRFVPDRQVPLPDSPTPGQRVPHAFGYRSYSPIDMAALDGHDLEAGATELPVMIHDGKVQKWSSGTSRRGRKLPPKLSPLTPEDAQGLGVAMHVQYLSRVEGRLIVDSMLGLDEATPHFDRVLINSQLPAIRLGAIAQGIDDSRELRGIYMTVDGTPSICIEPDNGVYYAAPVPRLNSETLHFIPMKQRDDIAAYLRHSERQRLLRENPQSVQVQRTIAEMTFNYLRPGFEPHEQALYASYREYADYCRSSGKPNELETFAFNVFSGGREQKAFVDVSRQFIPDWKALQTCSQEERRQVADMLNRLLPVEGKEAGWIPLTADSLALPETAQELIRHVTGANFAYAEVETTHGTLVIASLSGGDRARRLTLKLPAQTPGIRYVDARSAGVPANPAFVTLPVLRTADDTRTIVFDRGGDSENWIFRYLLSLLQSEDPAIRLLSSDIHRVRLVSFLNTCSSCGGVVLPTVKQTLDSLGAKVEFSVRYLVDYVK